MHIYRDVETKTTAQVKVELDDVMGATIQFDNRTVTGQLTTAMLGDVSMPLVITDDNEAIVFSLDSNYMYPRANNKPYKKLLLQFKSIAGVYAASITPDGITACRPVTHTNKDWCTVNTGGNREIQVVLGAANETMKCDVVFASHRSIAVRTPTGTILAFNLPYGEQAAERLRSTCRDYYLLETVRTSEKDKG